MEREPFGARLNRPDVDRVDAPGRVDTPSEALRRFRPERARLAPLSPAEADAYIRTCRAENPAVRAIEKASPEARGLLVALIKGRGHAVERHEGGVTSTQTDRRVRLLEDPAITDDALRASSRDAYKPGRHKCGAYATRIADPDAFAVCAARTIEHPLVRAVLDRPYDPADQASGVEIPLVDLLGPDGYKYCAGHALKPIQGSVEIALACRATWVDALRNNSTPDAPAPESVLLRPDHFKESVVRSYFRPTLDRTGWELATMYVHPKPPGGRT